MPTKWRKEPKRRKIPLQKTHPKIDRTKNNELNLARIQPNHPQAPPPRPPPMIPTQNIKAKNATTKKGTLTLGTGKSLANTMKTITEDEATGLATTPLTRTTDNTIEPTKTALPIEQEATRIKPEGTDNITKKLNIQDATNIVTTTTIATAATGITEQTKPGHRKNPEQNGDTVQQKIKIPQQTPRIA